MKRILIVEDEIPISRVLRAYLEKHGFAVSQAFTIQQASLIFTSEAIDLVLLDVMLPDGTGWEFLQTIRAHSPCPIIMLTALGDVPDRLRGLQNGADDYMSKPFVAEEVVARIQAVLRRPTRLLDEIDARHFGKLRIHQKERQIFLHNVEVPLTPKDRALLLFLAKHPNQIFTREQLLEHVWGMNYYGSDRAVDLAVKRIRHVLKKWPKSEGEIRTIRGMGYEFHVETN
ncbi:response regulator transcription factor [Paenisporosarcina antarctica]|uniref:Response regulator transcription factor n=1 Tax=Paenisporosarcina antarctica TaxID=417367 RepID=A0A4P7A282_9BACL|nr:response regulator transcription factor [Paenisporosarcina antarctica]QBP42833.1 response regulator transcription factor [Paenisporosarcina antarctica]